MAEFDPNRDPASLVNVPRSGFLARLAGAILFYTRLPLPSGWQPSWEGIAALAPLVGLGLATMLALVDGGLDYGGMPRGIRSALVVGLWVWLTGGLHLDGAMDTADGLAVNDPDRRLVVMADSRVGAFGVLAAIASIGAKDPGPGGPHRRARDGDGGGGNLGSLGATTGDRWLPLFTFCG
ncbi:MAG: adenosylcobinamide-GDP ribazoletransferase [Nodosilinea sp. LVE1205-7]|jgi:hypothetical protein